MAGVAFKKSGKLGGLRKRPNERRSDDEDEDQSAVVKRDKKKETVLSFQTGSTRGNKAAISEADADEDEQDGDSRRKFSVLDKMNAKIELGLAYASKRTTESSVSREHLATAANEIETEHDRDTQAIYERSQKMKMEEEKQGETSKAKAPADAQGEEKVYRGRAGYKQYVEVRDTSVANATSAMVRGGPVRAPTNVRMSTRWDYQPDLCKDYNETGYCVFGDSCKFLHDRTDYKHGWQLEREQADSHSNEATSYEIRENDDESLPFKCLLCRGSFNQPVVTKCGHYFCEKCALQHNRKSTRCYVCGRPTEGVFRVATKILERLNAQRQARNEERRRLQIENEDNEELPVEEDEHEEQGNKSHEDACHDHGHAHAHATAGSESESESASEAVEPESRDDEKAPANVSDLNIPIEQELDDLAQGDLQGEDNSGSDSDDD